MKIKSSVKGFTLLELLVVVLIIGILAGIALPQYKTAVLKSKYATMKDIVRVVTEAEQRYYMIYNEYTTNFNDLDIKYSGLTQSGKAYYFKGGNCALHWWGKPNQGIICILTTTTPQLSIEYIYRTSHKDCRVIYIPDNKANTLQDAICKQETGKSKPTYSDGESNVYYY